MVKKYIQSPSGAIWEYNPKKKCYTRPDTCVVIEKRSPMIVKKADSLGAFADMIYIQADDKNVPFVVTTLQRYAELTPEERETHIHHYLNFGRLYLARWTSEGLLPFARLITGPIMAEPQWELL